MARGHLNWKKLLLMLAENQKDRYYLADDTKSGSGPVVVQPDRLKDALDSVAQVQEKDQHCENVNS